jgi:hypothetical protein
VIENQLQLASGHGKLIQFSDNPEFAHSVMDLSSVYQGQADSAVRGVALLPSGEVLIQDQLSGLKPGSRVRWGMVTPAAADNNGNAVIKLRQQEATLELAILSPSSTAWQLIDTSKPRNPWDSPNRDTRMIAFEAVATQSGQLSFAVLVTPGSCSDSVRGTLQPRPLEQWNTP